jgi:TIR domain
LKLAKELREAGIQLWIDQLDILGGQRWDDAIQAALASSHGILAVLSSARSVLALALAVISAGLGCGLFARGLQDLWPMALYFGLPGAALGALAGASLKKLFGWDL